jgi:hypothetical protein
MLRYDENMIDLGRGGKHEALRFPAQHTDVRGFVPHWLLSYTKCQAVALQFPGIFLGYPQARAEAVQ